MFPEYDEYGNVVKGRFTIRDDDNKELVVIISDNGIVINGVNILLSNLASLSVSMENISHLQVGGEKVFQCCRDAQSKLVMKKISETKFDLTTHSRVVYEYTINYGNEKVVEPQIYDNVFRDVAYHFSMPAKDIFSSNIADIRATMLNINNMKTSTSIPTPPVSTPPPSK